MLFHGQEAVNFSLTESACRLLLFRIIPSTSKNSPFSDFFPSLLLLLNHLSSVPTHFVVTIERIYKAMNVESQLPFPQEVYVSTSLSIQVFSPTLPSLPSLFSHTCCSFCLKLIFQGPIELSHALGPCLHALG